MHGMDHEGLAVDLFGSGTSGVSCVTDTEISPQFADVVIVEDVLYKSHALVDIVIIAAVARDDASRFLTTIENRDMLQRKNY